MKVSLILRKVNKQLDDEGLTTDDILGYLDAAIAEINKRCYSLYPSFSELSGQDDPSGIEIAQLNYNYLPDMWIDIIVVPYVCARYRLQDDEDATFYIRDYERNINDLINTYKIPEEYQDKERIGLLFGGDVDVSRTFSGGGW